MDTKKPSNARIQDMLGQIRLTFIESLPERLATIDNYLIKMEEHHGILESDFNDMFRMVHSIKGSGGSLGLHILTSICHQFEDVLTTASKNLSSISQSSIEQCFAYNDLMREVVTETSKGIEEFPGIEKKLFDIHARYSEEKFSVLLVESSKLNAQIYQQSLKGLPVRVETIYNGLEALSRALNEPFSILITSIEITGLNGLALISAIRLTSLKNRQLKTILLTSNNEQAKHTNRTTDADFTVLKNQATAVKLHEAVASVIASMSKNTA